MRIHEIKQNQSLLSAEQWDHLNQLYSDLSQSQISEKPLRTLKGCFPEWGTLAEDIDTFVKLGIMERYDRRYRFCLPTLSPELTNQTEAQVSALLSELDNWLPHQLAILINRLNGASQPTFYLGEEENQPTYVISSLAGEQLHFVDIAKVDEVVGLASYFMNPSQSNPLTTKIRQRIGDVDQAFYVAFTEKTMALLEKSVGKKVKETIFTQTLVDLGYLTLTDETNEVRTIKPIIEWQASDEALVQEGYKRCWEQLGDLSAFEEAQTLRLLTQKILARLEGTTYIYKKGDTIK